jgi:hypothetical protein
MGCVHHHHKVQGATSGVANPQLRLLELINIGYTRKRHCGTPLGT